MLVKESQSSSLTDEVENERSCVASSNFLPCSLVGLFLFSALTLLVFWFENKTFEPEQSGRLGVSSWGNMIGTAFGTALDYVGSIPRHVKCIGACKSMTRTVSSQEGDSDRCEFGPVEEDIIKCAFWTGPKCNGGIGQIIDKDNWSQKYKGFYLHLSPVLENKKYLFSEAALHFKNYGACTDNRLSLLLDGADLSDEPSDIEWEGVLDYKWRVDDEDYTAKWIDEHVVEWENNQKVIANKEREDNAEKEKIAQKERDAIALKEQLGVSGVIKDKDTVVKEEIVQTQEINGVKSPLTDKQIEDEGTEMKRTLLVDNEQWLRCIINTDMIFKKKQELENWRLLMAALERSGVTYLENNNP